MGTIVFWVGAAVGLLSTMLMGVIGLYGTWEKYQVKRCGSDLVGTSPQAEAGQKPSIKPPGRTGAKTAQVGEPLLNAAESSPGKAEKRLFRAHCVAFACGLVAAVITFFGSAKASKLSDKVDEQKGLLAEQKELISNVQKALDTANQALTDTNTQLRDARNDRKATDKELAATKKTLEATKSAADSTYDEVLQLRPIKEKHEQLLAAVNRSGQLSEDVKGVLASQEMDRKQREETERIAAAQTAVETRRRTTQNFVATFRVPEAVGPANVIAKGRQVKDIRVYVPVAIGTLELQCEPGHGVHWEVGQTGDFSLAFDDAVSRQGLQETVVTPVGAALNFNGVAYTRLSIKFPENRDPIYEITIPKGKKK